MASCESVAKHNAVWWCASSKCYSCLDVFPANIWYLQGWPLCLLEDGMWGSTTAHADYHATLKTWDKNPEDVHFHASWIHFASHHPLEMPGWRNRGKEKNAVCCKNAEKQQWNQRSMKKYLTPYKFCLFLLKTKLNVSNNQTHFNNGQSNQSKPVTKWCDWVLLTMGVAFTVCFCFYLFFSEINTEIQTEFNKKNPQFYVISEKRYSSQLVPLWKLFMPLLK